MRPSNITNYRGQIATAAGRVDAPASDELARANELAGYFAKQLGFAERFGDKRVSLDIEQARELCQLLHDSLRTAEQLKGG